MPCIILTTLVIMGRVLVALVQTQKIERNGRFKFIKLCLLLAALPKYIVELDQTSKTQFDSSNELKLQLVLHQNQSNIDVA